MSEDLTTGLDRYCPWCDYRANTFTAVCQHMADEHEFLAGAAPPPDPRYTIAPPESWAVDV